MGVAGTIGLLAHTEGWHGWWLFAPFWILLWVLVITTLVRGRWGWRRCGTGRASASEVLAGRFARGEIDADEYRSRRATLEE